MSAHPLKILQIVSGENVNGAVVHCGLLSQRLAAAGHQVTVACRPGAWFPTRFSSDSYSIINSTMKRKRSEFKRMAAFVKEQQFDLIHTHMSSAHSFGIFLKWLTGVPCIATAHNCRFQIHWALNDFVIANSQATQAYQQKINRVSPKKIQTVYCYTDLQRFVDESPHARRAIRRQQGVPDDSKMIGVIGDVCKRKGHIHLIEALPELVCRFPDLTVLFVGNYNDRSDKYTRNIRRFLAGNKLYRRVRWLGRRDDIPKLVKSFDVSVIPSVEEPLGLVAMEALAAGTAVVASDTGGLPEIIKHEETGLLVPRMNSSAIVESVSRLLNDRALAEQLGKTGSRFVQATFRPDELTRQVEAVYERVVSRKNSKRLPETLGTHQNRAA